MLQKNIDKEKLISYWIKDNHKLLFSYCLFLHKDKPLAEDLIQDVYIKVWLLDYSRLVGVIKPLAFMKRIAYNLFVDQIKKEKRIFNHWGNRVSETGAYFKIDDGCDNEKRVDDINLLEKIQAVLTEEEYEIVVLTMEGYSRKEIIERLQLDIKPDSLSSKLNRLKKKISIKYIEDKLILSVVHSSVIEEGKIK